MIKVVESVRDNPIQLFPDKTIIFFQPGLVSQMVEIDGVPSCTISDGTRPFGLIEKTDKIYGLVSIWFDTMIVRTDMFESTCSYLPGNSLYVSKNGKITTQKIDDNSILVGHVISGPNDKKKYVELNWI